jgi:quercetin dioxygenase-like cupin family protein
MVPGAPGPAARRGKRRGRAAERHRPVVTVAESGQGKRMTDIRRTPLFAQPLPAGPDRVESYRVELPPGHPTGPHRHPGAVTGYIEHGRVAFEPDGHPARELGPGDVFFEPAGAVIRRFDNASDREPAEFVAFYLLSGDQELIEPIG